jgi:hypothetical protein
MQQLHRSWQHHAARNNQRPTAMNNVIFTFSKPSATATVHSSRLSLFLAKVLDLPLIWDEEIRDVKADTLIMVAGSFAFCGQLENLARAIRRAKRIVWVEVDYTVIAPKAISNAESPFRKAFRIRHDRGKAPLDYWTTVKNHVDFTKDSWYVNWNSLAYNGKPHDIARRPEQKDIFYYGAFRVNRMDSFHRYFDHPKVPLTISNATQKFATAFPRANCIGSISRDVFFGELHKHGLGLYLEDKKSHTENHSPSTRFYEMLSAGLPMVFEPESAPMLLKAGFDVSEYVVRNGNDIRKAMDRRVDIATAQLASWHHPYRAWLRKRLKKIYRAYTHKHFPGETR